MWTQYYFLMCSFIVWSSCGVTRKLSLGFTCQKPTTFIFSKLVLVFCCFLNGLFPIFLGATRQRCSLMSEGRLCLCTYLSSATLKHCSSERGVKVPRLFVELRSLRSACRSCLFYYMSQIYLLNLFMVYLSLTS